ncbi:phosphoribosyltransferase [Halosimplex amylolyticum]|uniref:phosphoribosyltransferase n=1 Tax=Halosimplex amylolyticum TaxID=3396616 RepID=UPI003F562DEF
MNYRDVSDLQETTRQMAHDLPADIDLVVAIPRSGLLAANLLCLYMDVPMTDVDGLCRGQLFDTGNRYEESMSPEEIDTALVFDDSVYSGTQMTETQGRLREKDFSFDLEYAAAYITRDTHDYVDYWGEVVQTPRAFEWNVLHHYDLMNFCVDIDGVLCRDPHEEENDDGENYREFISEVDPKILPNRRIGWLVTCRLEKYREETEAWLGRHDIEYDNLVMMDHPSMEARQEAGDYAEYKANVYEETGAKLFIESRPHLAAEICDLTNRPVYCYETNEMVQPGRIGEAYRKSNDYLSLFRENPVGFSMDTGEYLLSRVKSRMRR